jgi:hypothetical protein
VPNPGCLFIGHGPKTLPVTWLTRSLIFLIKNSPDQVEGYLDYLQPAFSLSATRSGGASSSESGSNTSRVPRYPGGLRLQELEVGRLGGGGAVRKGAQLSSDVSTSTFRGGRGCRWNSGGKVLMVITIRKISLSAATHSAGWLLDHRE